MVFSSIPAYLDPANWQQHQQNYQPGSSGSNPQFPTPAQPLPPQQQAQPPPQPHGGGGGAGSIRPGSMADRARMANMPMPETALKCPRCESTNTKFCYFNNYSLSQPRHFCKTCRRYWTRGGALRNVPVGGGCRRNKRSKGNSSSKSPATSGGDCQTASGSISSTVPSNNTGTPPNILGLTSQIPQLRFLAPLSHLNHDYGSDIGLHYDAGISAPLAATSEMNFQIGSATGGVEQWRLLQQPPQQLQFPFLGSFDPSSQGLGLYPNYQGGGLQEASDNYAGAKLSNSMLSQQLASVKMEENNQNSSLLSRQFLGGIQDHGQWSNTGSAWTELSAGFSSSSTSNQL